MVEPAVTLDLQPAPWIRLGLTAAYRALLDPRRGDPVAIPAGTLRDLGGFVATAVVEAQ